MKKKIWIIIAIVIVLIGGGVTWAMMATNNKVADVPQASPTVEVQTPEATPAASTEAPKSKQFTWLVEPKFAYYDVFYDTACDVILATKTENGDLLDIDPNTGEKAPSREHAHGGGDLFIAYNNIMKKFGTFNSFDYSAKFQYDSIEAALTDYNNLSLYNSSSSMRPVLTVNSTQNLLGVSGDGNDVDSEFGKIAYTHRFKLVTDYIFEDNDSNLTTINPAVKLNGKWGFIDENGKVIIDYQFEDAVSYDNTRAFVKLGGKWGIIYKVPAKN
ncbi:MAG: WG repeat-containing protein [Clostridiales bacterium]|jgi:hypothetical protein|nr:WG repeat-containing protein [Clostridiales bacterium]